MTLLDRFLAWIRGAKHPPASDFPAPPLPMTAKVQMFVTKDMKMQLNGLGWSKDQVALMLPEVAAEFIRLQRGPW